MLLISDECPTDFLSAQLWARAAISVHCQKAGLSKRVTPNTEGDAEWITSLCRATPLKEIEEQGSMKHDAIGIR